MYPARVPLKIVYEGDDAAGKGGNIKRVAQAIDARGYTVFPSAAPTMTVARSSQEGTATEI